MDPLFFKKPTDFRVWLEENHDKLPELWVGYYKKGAGQESITWPESVDEALCFGWIDGIRKSIDDSRYKIRFTPRKKSSIWSAVNIKRVEELTASGLMKPSGLAAFEKRKDEKSKIYAYEQKNATLPEAYLQQIRSNDKAFDFFEKLPPSAKQLTSWWVMSAKQEETRLKRLAVLIECSEQGLRIPQIRREKK